MTDASRLAQPIQKMFTEENESKQKEYDKASLLWDRERQQAMKEKRNPNIDLRPEPVKRRTLMVPADVSRTQLVKLLSTSPQGILLNVSEMDTLRTASNAEYGKFDDLMRACYHHEMFGTDFKSDGQQYMVYCPKMAFCASGTPNQFLRLCPSIEDGSYSRYLIYLGEQDVNFRSMAPTDARYNRNQLFRELGGEVLDIWFNLSFALSFWSVISKREQMPVLHSILYGLDLRCKRFLIPRRHPLTVVFRLLTDAVSCCAVTWSCPMLVSASVMRPATSVICRSSLRISVQ